jgi:hypothetical protein
MSVPFMSRALGVGQACTPFRRLDFRSPALIPVLTDDVGVGQFFSAACSKLVGPFTVFEFRFGA